MTKATAKNQEDTRKMKMIWSRKIKLVQFGIVVSIVVVYILINTIKTSIAQSDSIDASIKSLENNKVKLEKQLSDLKETNEKLDVVFQSSESQSDFIKTYNSSYGDYIKREPNIEDLDSKVSLVDKMQEDGFDSEGKQFTETEIRNIAVSMNLYNDDKTKIDFDHERLIKNLNEFIYTGSTLEEKIWAVAFWVPKKVESNAGLYKSNFTIATTVDDYDNFISLLWQFENNISDDNDARVFYNLTTISAYSLDDESQSNPQDVNIGWYFYYYK